MVEAYKRLKSIALGEEKHGDSNTAVAILATCTSVPHFSGIGYHDYMGNLDHWIDAHVFLLTRFPQVVWMPGPIFEVGPMAISLAYGAKCRFSDKRTPECVPIPIRLEDLEEARPVDIMENGLMPLVLVKQRQIEERLAPDGLNRGFAFSWGPMSITHTMTSIESLLIATVEAPGLVKRVLEKMTDTSIQWLHAQLDVMGDPQGIFIGDDMTGMLSEPSCRELVLPSLKRISEEFDGLVKVYHNDTVCPHLLEVLPEAGFHIWHFSQEIDMAKMVEKTSGLVVPMGNIAPLEVGMRGSVKDVKQAAAQCMEAVGDGPLILSWGGGMAGETPLENIDALVQATKR